MRLFVLSLFVFLGLVPSSYAIQIYTCNLAAWEKSNPRYVRNIPVYLLKQYSNQIQVHTISTRSTMLEVSVQNGALEGFVNGQHNFILKGTPEAGSFESANQMGQFSCSSMEEVNVIYMFKPWKQWFVRGGVEIQKDVKLDPYGFICYEGSVEQVVLDVMADNNVAKADISVKGGEVSFVRMEKECLQGEGSYDDYRCVKYSEPRPKTYKISTCFDYEDSRY